MSDFISSFHCPICGKSLRKEGKSLYCIAGHCYDYAKSGYVNLLMSQQGGLHGDDRRMVRARTAFLSSGYYRPLLDRMYSTVVPYLPKSPKIFDAGCGEGWYTEAFHENLIRDGYTPQSIGVDISRDALSVAAKRPFVAEFAVASLFHIPVPDHWADLILNVFAPDCTEEFLRILSPGGYFLKVIPREDHLMELKQAVYDSVYINEVPPAKYQDFVLLSDTILRQTLYLPNNETVRNLFEMTPYGRKTSPADLAKLDKIESLNTTISFSLRLYRKG